MPQLSKLFQAENVKFLYVCHNTALANNVRCLKIAVMKNPCFVFFFLYNKSNHHSIDSIPQSKKVRKIILRKKGFGKEAIISGLFKNLHLDEGLPNTFLAP